MWQVTYNHSVVVVLSSGGNVSSSATDGRQVHGKYQWYSRREAGDIALSADGRILSAVKRAGLFYRLKLRTLFFRIIKRLHVL